MLDPWIIEEILRREDDRRQEQPERRIELPLEQPHYQEAEKQPATDNDDRRGVVVIDI